MKHRFIGNDIFIVKKSTLLLAAALAGGGYALYRYSKKGHHLADDVKELAHKGSKEAKKAATQVKKQAQKLSKH